jgi:hypothetical protein
VPTTTIEARCNARPTRLAFILPHPDRNLLLSVIARATTLWGGLFNPIIILDGSTRKTAGVHYTTLPTEPYLTIQSNILKAFDPDLLISYSSDPLPPELKGWQHRTFPAERLDWRPFSTTLTSYFVDILPILNDLWDKEFKGVVKPRLKLKFVARTEAQKSLFRAARFGLYSSDEYYDFLSKNFKAEILVDDAAFRSMRWPGDFQSLLGLTTLYCQSSRQRVHSHAFFLLNPNDPFDVVDYWNLRASGTYLFPLTLETYQECSNPIRDFGAASAYPINDNVTNHPTIIKAPSIDDGELESATRWILSQGLVKELSMMGWVPTYEDGPYGVVDELSIEQVRGFEANAVGVLVDGYGKIEGPKPSFLTRDNMSEHWSMDISFSTFRTPNACYNLPWLNSGCDALVGRNIGLSHELDAARVSKEGIVVHQDGDSGDVRVNPINAIQVVRSFLEGNDIEYLTTSSPGLALTRIIEMMQGFYRCEIFQNSAIRETLEELSAGKPRLGAEVVATVKRSLRDYKLFGRQATPQQISERAQHLLSRAIEANIFRVGLVFQCSRCHRHNWYAVTEFDRHYNCKSCFSLEESPRLDTTKWHYSSDGLFRSSNKLDGNITILLTLAFFENLLDHDLKYIPSFEYNLNGEPHEMDFGIIAHKMLRPNADMIFGESKSGAALKEEERKKLKTFGVKTGAYLCFCTLSEDFEDTDKDFFKELYEEGIKVIMLPRFFLEMDSFDLLRFRSKNNPGRSKTDSEWLMRLTAIRTLGKDFANKHRIWL